MNDTSTGEGRLRARTASTMSLPYQPLAHYA